MSPESSEDAARVSENDVSGEAVARFAEDGFLVLEGVVLTEPGPEEYREGIRRVLNGVHLLGRPPDSVAGTSPPQTAHIVNAHYTDPVFRRLAMSRSLAHTVLVLMGWQEYGVRFAEDQVWGKPPGAGALTFHRDTTYFDFLPKEVCTVWITFDDLSEELGPLEYCGGSHRWGDASRRGSAGCFFDKDHRGMMLACAAAEGAEARLTPVSAPAGGASVHNGRTWHGSGPNRSSKEWRRGVGLHYIRGDATFQPGRLGRLWAPYKQGDSLQLPEDRFPLVCPPVA